MRTGSMKTGDCLKKRPTHENKPIEEWDLLIRINLRAPYLCTHFALPHLNSTKTGHDYQHFIRCREPRSRRQERLLRIQAWN